MSQEKYKCKDSSYLCAKCPYPWCVDGLPEDEALQVVAETKNQMDIKELRSLNYKRYYARHAEKARQRGRDYYNNNKEKCKARQKAWRNANPDKIKAYRDSIPSEKKDQYRANARERYWEMKRQSNG